MQLGPDEHPALREGLDETLTLTRLGKKTLSSTNPIESMIETVRRPSRNVKRWQSGDMCLRWTAAGVLEAETRFRRIVGFPDLAKLAIAVERDLNSRSPYNYNSQPIEEAATPDPHTGTAVTNFHHRRDNLRNRSTVVWWTVADQSNLAS